MCEVAAGLSNGSCGDGLFSPPAPLRAFRAIQTEREYAKQRVVRVREIAVNTRAMWRLSQVYFSDELAMDVTLATAQGGEQRRGGFMRVDNTVPTSLLASAAGRGGSSIYVQDMRCHRSGESTSPAN
jgi:hypothetical protein